ncbi:hypothetical protein HPB48_010879 [Haemaphysalis longicornis]|uniref:Uncharacterized protein n=1 Tax=Haemaphysalis longicornis TaxID=44386 RepID=A0A9J6FYP4_HAELO|nr:hypothetical protein HPB48_010879 [Haemaphysalis longicornis]
MPATVSSTSEPEERAARIQPGSPGVKIPLQIQGALQRREQGTINFQFPQKDTQCQAKNRRRCDGSTGELGSDALSTCSDPFSSYPQSPLSMTSWRDLNDEMRSFLPRLNNNAK